MLDCPFTLLPAAVIGSQVWLDLNGNGEWDKGEPFVDANGTALATESTTSRSLSRSALGPTRRSTSPWRVAG